MDDLYFDTQREVYREPAVSAIRWNGWLEVYYETSSFLKLADPHLTENTQFFHRIYLSFFVMLQFVEDLKLKGRFSIRSPLSKQLSVSMTPKFQFRFLSINSGLQIRLVLESVLFLIVKEVSRDIRYSRTLLVTLQPLPVCIFCLGIFIRKCCDIQINKDRDPENKNLFVHLIGKKTANIELYNMAINTSVTHQEANWLWRKLHSLSDALEQRIQQRHRAVEPEETEE